MSRKYSHQGYQDKERRDERDRKKPPPNRNLTTEERIQLRSLRRATAREANEVIRCHNCGRNVQNFETIRQDSTCPHCQALLHCCRTCQHFDSAARWQCRAEITEPISDKRGANQCKHYTPRLVLDSTGRRSAPNQGPVGPREQFENLFKR